jgi:hypothetical protein
MASEEGDILLGAGVGYAAYSMGPVGIGVLAGYQIFSGLRQSKKIKEQARKQAALMELNAKYLEADAYEAEKFGETKMARYQSVVDANIGEQKQAYAAQGVDVNSGTAKAVQTESQVVGFLNSLEIQKEARQRAAGLRREAANVRRGIGVMTAQAAADASATRLQAFAKAAETGLAGYARYGEKPSTNTAKSTSTSQFSSGGYAGSYEPSKTRVSNSWPGLESTV